MVSVRCRAHLWKTCYNTVQTSFSIRQFRKATFRPAFRTWLVSEHARVHFRVKQFQEMYISSSMLNSQSHFSFASPYVANPASSWPPKLISKNINTWLKFLHGLSASLRWVFTALSSCIMLSCNAVLFRAIWQWFKNSVRVSWPLTNMIPDIHV